MAVQSQLPGMTIPIDRLRSALAERYPLLRTRGARHMSSQAMMRRGSVVLLAGSLMACHHVGNGVGDARSTTSSSGSLVSRTFVVSTASGHADTVRVTLAFTGDTLAKRPLPLVLSLHYSAPSPVPLFYGAGLLERVVLPALGSLGAIFVAPDLTGAGWASRESEQRVLALLDSISAHYPVDEQRTLLTGYSLGGMGTWYLASRNPERFRAAIPMASLPVLSGDAPRPMLIARADSLRMSADSAWIAPLRRVPWMVLQSRADDRMPIATIEAFVQHLNAHGVAAQLTVADAIQHQETGRYRELLAATVPWIRQQWARP